MTQNDAEYKQNKQPTNQLILKGDVVGTMNANTVIAIQSVSVASGVPTDDQYLTYLSGSTNWSAQNQLVAHNIIFGVTAFSTGIRPINTGLTTYAMANTDIVLECLGSYGTLVTLPTSPVLGQICGIFNDITNPPNINGDNGFCVINYSGYTINGSSSTLVNILFKSSYMFVYTGSSNWNILVATTY